MANPSVTAVTTRQAGSSSTAIQQIISSGSTSNVFNGTLPQASGPVRADSPLYKPGNAIYKYAASTAGGLFFWNNQEPLIVSQCHVSLASSESITISIVNLDPTTVNADSPTILTNESLIVEQATGVTFIALDEARFKTVLLPFQAISIVTTNAGAGLQIAQVVASLERTYVR
jgi:archaellum component FlaF (FlaF/FlaG flagellin family)